LVEVDAIVKILKSQRLLLRITYYGLKKFLWSKWVYSLPDWVG